MASPSKHSSGSLSKDPNRISVDRCIPPLARTGGFHSLAASQPVDMGQGYLTVCQRTVGGFSACRLGLS